MRDLVIIGAGGFGREVHHFAVWGTSAILVAHHKDLKYTDNMLVVIGVGDPHIRKAISAALENDKRWINCGAKFTAFRHISVIDEGNKEDEYGEGSIICQNCILSVDTVVGKHVHINFACTIGHDCIIGDFVTISPGVHISGNVTIGDEVFIGTGAVIREKLTIGKGATIGMGAVVVKDVPPGVTVVGNPAREINMSRKLYWPIRSKKAQAEPVAYENNQNNESGFLNPLLLGGVEDGYISYDGEKRKVHPDDVEKFLACVQEHRA